MPTSSNIDKYSEVYLEAKMLLYKISLLKRQSKLLLFMEFFSLLLLPIYFWLLYFLIYVYETKEAIMVALPMSILLFCFFVFYLLQGRVEKKIFPLYYDVQIKWSELSDKVDWTTMRKKQLYSTLDKLIQEPLDEFSRYRHSVLCPAEGGRKMRSLLKTMFYLELLVCPVLTIILLL